METYSLVVFWIREVEFHELLEKRFLMQCKAYFYMPRLAPVGP